MLSTMRFRLLVPLLLAAVSVMAAVPTSAGSATPTKSSGCGRKAAAGATSRHVTVDGTVRDYLLSIPDGYDPSEPALCDRSIMAQVEVRTRLGLNLGYRLRDSEGKAGRFIGIEEADLVILTDAGKAWLAGDGPGQVPVNRIPSFHEWKADVGIGLDAGQIGAYLAKSLSDGEPVRFLVRLQRRF